MQQVIAGGSTERARLGFMELSGRFGSEKWNGNGYLVSNDTGIRGYQPAINSMRDSVPPDGLGFFVGQGAIFSLLPDLTIVLPVIVDINPAVPEFAMFVGKTIIDSPKPVEALDRIYSKVRAMVKDERSYGFEQIVRECLVAERNVFGKSHWTNAERFPLVQRALIAKPLVAITADISDPGFIESLGEIVESTERPITFANFTNVAEYRELHYDLDNDFLEDYPIGEKALILYSSHKQKRHGGNLPEFRLALGMNSYIAQTRYLRAQPWY